MAFSLLVGSTLDLDESVGFPPGAASRSGLSSTSCGGALSPAVSEAGWCGPILKVGARLESVNALVESRLSAFETSGSRSCCSFQCTIGAVVAMIKLLSQSFGRRPMGEG